MMARLEEWRDELRDHLSQPTSGDRDRATLLKLAALLHDAGKPQTRSQDESGRVRFWGHEKSGAEIAARALRRLRFSGEEVTLARRVVAHHLRPLHLSRAEKVTRRAVYRFFRDTGEAGVDVVLLSLADHMGITAEWPRAADVAAILLEAYFYRRREIISPPKLVGGRDLMAEFDLAPGPRIGELLERVREAQAEGRISKRQEALSLVSEILKEHPVLPQETPYGILEIES
ncbi:MAG: hypothetical protein B6I34_00890 [Anaerolineaceae bacterium 4572_32.1]|nr:MAG: hypothetical protein B6I34_00890 [Anaerolineaceae bacterium 4572_32.1]